MILISSFRSKFNITFFKYLSVQSQSIGFEVGFEGLAEDFGTNVYSDLN